MIINMSGGGSPGKTVTVHVTPGTGANVTCTNGKKTFTGTTDASGDAVFKLTKGVWTITAENSGATFTQNVNVSDDCTVNISLEQIPEFTYTGDYEIVDDNNTPISSTLGNWKIRFLTSGTLTFTALNGASDGIDVFLVGGGGGGSNTTNEGGYFCSGSGGGGGGYTATYNGMTVGDAIDYNIVVGAGGSAGSNGGESSAFGVSISGGKRGSSGSGGGSGGSGGGGGGESDINGGKGGSDGSNGTASYSGAGTGQGTTTREFGESSGKLYAGGGGGGGKTGASGGSGGGGAGASNSSATASASSGTVNAGGGGGGGNSHYSTGGVTSKGGSGGSGIVIIRNAREVA